MNKETTIEAVDASLSVLRTAWLEAGPEDKEKWMARINDQLDLRNELKQ